MRPAHDPTDIMDAAIIGNHGHRLVERVGLLVQRLDALTSGSAAGDHRPAQLGEVVDMRRAPGREH